MFLICMISHVENIFICLTICISSLKNIYSNLLPIFKSDYFVFLLLSCRISLCILVSYQIYMYVYICVYRDGWMASLTQWTWVWVSSRNWWWTGKPGVLQSIQLQTVRHNWATELNWCIYMLEIFYLLFTLLIICFAVNKAFN